MDKTAIVILNWNGARMMRKYLPLVLEHSGKETTVYVGDNGSTDGSVEMLERDFSSVRVIRLDKNYGFAEGYNKTFAHIKAEYYVMLNSDVEVTPHWLDPLIDFMDRHGDVAACQPKLRSVNDRGSFEYAGACGGFIDKYGYPFCRGRIFGTVEKDRGQYDTPAEILWATGACLVIRSADYWNAGGLDGRFFAHCEEIDLCWRLCLSGRKIYCLPESCVYHIGGGTLPKKNSMKTFLNFRNNLTMLYKNLPAGELRGVMRVRGFLDMLAAVQSLFTGNGVADFKAIIRARREFNKWRKDFEKDREEIQRRRATDRTAAYKGFSILWQYYAKRRRTYSELP